MKKILYLITSPSHCRVFESFVERKSLEQLVVGPKTTKLNHMVDESYSQFKIKNIKLYSNKKELNDIISEFKPDIVVNASLPSIKGDFKKAFVSHGLVGNHVIDLTKKEKMNIDCWLGLDLYCGAWDLIFNKWVKYAGKSNNILTNAFPQLDILYNKIHEKNKNSILKKSHPHRTQSKSILFFGFCCKGRADFKKHNLDYIDTVIELQKFASKKDVAVYIKPRQEQFKILNFISQYKERLIDYNKCIKDKNICFIGPTNNHILSYYFADIFIINGCSSVEVEACALQKPLFVVRTKENSTNGYDPYETVKNGAAVEITDINKIQIYIDEYLKYGKHHNPEAQKKLLSNMGISFDGLHHKRIQDKLMEL